MKFSLEYLNENLSYEAVIDDIVFYGNLDYVSSHLADGICSSFTISQNQDKTIKPFVDKYLEAVNRGEQITITEFYRKAI